MQGMLERQEMPAVTNVPSAVLAFDEVAISLRFTMMVKRDSRHHGYIDQQQQPGYPLASAHCLLLAHLIRHNLATKVGRFEHTSKRASALILPVRPSVPPLIPAEICQWDADFQDGNIGLLRQR